MSWKRLLLLGVALLITASAAFWIPTLWGKPWFIDHFYTRVFAEFALRQPMLLSQLRILEPYGIDFHSDDLGDFSTEFERETARMTREALETLRRYDRSSQSESQRLSSDVLEWFLVLQIEGEPYLFHDYPVNQMNGIQSQLPDFMLNIHQIHDREDAEDYVVRLSRFGAAFDQVIDGLRYRQERGVLPPRFVIERVQEEVRALRETAPGELVLYASLDERLGRVPGLDSEDRAQLLEGARHQIETTVLPAFERLSAQLDRMHGRAGDDDGVWSLPDGDAYYAWLLRRYTTTDRSAEDIHALGLREVKRIHSQMRAILEGEGMASDDLAGTLRALSADPRFTWPDDDGGREAILEAYAEIVRDAGERLPALFGLLPRAPVSVERVPEFKQAGAPLAYYNPPPFDGSKPGVFFANLRSPSEHAKFGMRTLAYHEAVPGHHLQIATAQEVPGLPFFRRVLPFTAFVEGWALYAERLAAEQGFHPTPWDRLGQLVDEVFRAVRLVVDTGIHAKRWTREQAIDYMVENTGKVRGEVVAEIERYIVMPGQACAYKVGQLEILELRERAQRALGADFDLREFHDIVLGSGALPIAILERIVADWLASKRLDPTPTSSR